MEIVVFLEDFGIGQEVHLGAALLGIAGDLHGRSFGAIHHLDHAILHHALGEQQRVHLAFAAHREAQLAGERIHAAHAHAVQAAGHLVAVLVELAARVQLGQGDLCRRALGLVLVVHLDAGGNPAAVVRDGDGVVGMDGDDDVIAMPGQGLVDGVVDHLEHQVVQAGAVGRVADVHAGALAHRFQTFQDLDRAFAVAGVRGCGLREILGRVLRFGHPDIFADLTRGCRGFCRRKKACSSRLLRWSQTPCLRQSPWYRCRSLPPASSWH